MMLTPRIVKSSFGEKALLQVLHVLWNALSSNSNIFVLVIFQ